MTKKENLILETPQTERKYKDKLFRLVFHEKADRSLYGISLVQIPTPRFVVFYNGTEEQPERQILKLSDAFEKKVAEPEIELKVLMLNINLGKNKEF